MRPNPALLSALIVLFLGAPLGADEHEERRHALHRKMEELGQRHHHAIEELERKAHEIREEIEHHLLEIETRLESIGEDHAEYQELVKKRSEVHRKAKELRREIEERRHAIDRQVHTEREEIARAIHALEERSREHQEPRELPDGGGEPVTIELQELTMLECLTRLARDGGLSVVVMPHRMHDEPITAAFRDVPVLEAAMALLEAAGYRYHHTPSGVLIVEGHDPHREIEEIQIAIERDHHVLQQMEVTIERLQHEFHLRELERKLQGEPEEED